MHGLFLGNVASEASHGGPIGLMQDGDRALLDIPKRQLNIRVDDAEFR